jgi:hypothetical protein
MGKMIRESRSLKSRRMKRKARFLSEKHKKRSKSTPLREDFFHFIVRILSKINDFSDVALAEKAP